MAVLVHREGTALARRQNLQKHESSVQSWGPCASTGGEGEAWGGCWARDMGWVLKPEQDPSEHFILDASSAETLPSGGIGASRNRGERKEGRFRKRGWGGSCGSGLRWSWPSGVRAAVHSCPSLLGPQTGGHTFSQMDERPTSGSLLALILVI